MSSELKSMQKMPLISFIVPVYNGQQYICRCLDSLINQGKYDFEILIINDGSTDKTEELLHRYSAKDPRVQVYNQKNHGYVDTMNKLIAMANGKYIYSVDADNWVPKYLVKSAYELLRPEKFDFIQYSLFLKFSLDHFPEEKMLETSAQSFSSSLDINNAILRQVIYLASHGGKFIKSSLAKKFLFHGEPTGSDRRWLGQILAVSSSAAVMPSIGLYVEIRSESISRKDWKPIDHLHYSAEMLKDIDFYQTLSSSRDTTFYPQLKVCFDHFYRYIWGLISEEAKIDSFGVFIGKTIWRYRKLIFAPPMLKRKHFSLWLICNCPKIYMFAGAKRHLRAVD